MKILCVHEVLDGETYLDDSIGGAWRSDRGDTAGGSPARTRGCRCTPRGGCIIGRGGSKISEIRKSSGARISIAKAPHDDTGERMFTITGGPSANEKALYLLYENLEAEKMRRSQIPEAAA